jgi:hypothetical protein
VVRSEDPANVSLDAKLRDVVQKPRFVSPLLEAVSPNESADGGIADAIFVEPQDVLEGEHEEGETRGEGRNVLDRPLLLEPLRKGQCGKFPLSTGDGLLHALHSTPLVAKGFVYCEKRSRSALDAPNARAQGLQILWPVYLQPS